MALVRLENLSLAYGLTPLLDKASFSIEPGERVCLIGRNGTGKSTLMKIISGDVQADEGDVWIAPSLKIARLRQDVPRDDQRTVFDVVADGLGQVGELVREYHRLIAELSTSTDEKLMTRLSHLQQELEAKDGWRLEQRIETVITQLELPAEKSIADLSGGWRRRTLLAQTLVSEPDLLLLDEPTNHLDLEAILWMEQFLISQNISLLFITHDRAFLRRLATRIVELDRGHLVSWPGTYDDYLRRKEDALAAEEQQNALFDKRLAQEEVWIRQGIKARRTRNEGRVRRLEALRIERQQRRAQAGRVSMALDKGSASGKLVFDAENVSFSYEGQKLIDNFSTRIMRGDRIGLIGPNGSGKSTLLQLLLGQLQPKSGHITQGTNLQVAYFDQQREQLDPNRTVLDNVSDGKDFIDVNGKSLHIISYLRNFLFDPKRLETPVRALSGGECNRLLLAKLFSKPANLLVLDEPTNDLDLETLELLEELITDFDGTILLVSHDRDFLDNVVTSTIVFEGEGKISEYVGGYKDYLRQVKSQSQIKPETKAEKPKAAEVKPEPVASAPKRKLSYKDQRELETLPGLIEKLEKEQEQLQMLSGAADFYKKDPQEVNATLDRLVEIEKELEHAFERWGVLE